MKPRRWTISSLLLATIIGPAYASEFYGADPTTGCRVVLDSEQNPGEVFRWVGPCKDGLAAGRGILDWYDNGTFQATYEGMMAEGMLTGAGALRFLKDGKYILMTGEFQKGSLSGQGAVIESNGNSYSGVFSEGKLNGIGLFKGSNGATYEGEFRDNLPYGVGKSKTEDGEIYEGGFQAGIRHGDGTLEMTNGDFYSGQFMNGFAHGLGFYLTEFGDHYAGEFHEGKPHGVGTLTATNGTAIQGHFIDGKPDGTMLISRSDGSVSVEIWKNGRSVE